MTKVTITIDTKENTRLFLGLVKELSFVKNISTETSYDEGLSKEEINLLEERWSDYVKNPKDIQTWKDVKANLIKKHDV